VFAATLTCVALDGHPTQAPAAPASATPQNLSTAGTKPPADSSANAQAKELDPQPQPPADSQRRKQISAESMQLLAMAVELKAEVDKTNKDTLSLKVIRKADAIEKLAKAVKEKMKQNSGPS
jgi:type VI protein secretion system component VasF